MKEKIKSNQIFYISIYLFIFYLLCNNVKSIKICGLFILIGHIYCDFMVNKIVYPKWIECIVLIIAFILICHGNPFIKIIGAIMLENHLLVLLDIQNFYYYN